MAEIIALCPVWALAFDGGLRQSYDSGIRGEERGR